MQISQDYKYTFYGLGSMAIGAYIWYMAQDDKAIDYDPKKHGYKALKLIYEDLFDNLNDNDCSYVHSIIQAKQKPEWNGHASMEQFRQSHLEQSIKIYENIHKKHEIDEFTMNEAFLHTTNINDNYQNYLDENAQRNKRLDMMFKQEKIGFEHIKYDKMPDGLTPEKLQLVFRKLHQIFRYELFKLSQKCLSIQDEVQRTQKIRDCQTSLAYQFEAFASEAMKMYGIEKQPDEERSIKTILVKASIDYSSKDLTDYLNGQINALSFGNQLQKTHKMNDVITELIVACKDQKKYKELEAAGKIFHNCDPSIDARKFVEIDYNGIYVKIPIDMYKTKK